MAIVNSGSWHAFFLRLVTKWTSKLILLSALPMLVACGGDVFLEAESDLVIEGWIEEGHAPFVFVTTPAMIREDYQPLEELNRLVVRTARVSISTADTTVVLTGMTTQQHDLPFVYTTTRLDVRAGETYRLKVEYRNHTLGAAAHIPAACSLDSLWAVSANAEGYYLKARITPSPETDYVALFVRVKGENSDFRLVPRSCQKLEPGRVAILTVERPTIMNDQADFSSWFKRGEKIDVKAVALEERDYLYWKSFDESLQLSRNPFFPLTDNLPVQVEGGLGCWTGFGSSFGFIEIKN